MSTDEHKAVVTRFYQELDEHRPESAGQALAPDAVLHLPGMPGPADRRTFMQFNDMFYSAFPDGHHTFEDVIAEGDKVVTRGTFSGTHRGELQGIPATGKQVSLAVMHMDRLRDGKIVEHWGMGNMLDLMQQLGAIPRPGATGAKS